MLEGGFTPEEIEEIIEEMFGGEEEIRPAEPVDPEEPTEEVRPAEPAEEIRPAEPAGE
jgi:predicted Zn-dependent peptidase